MIDTQTLLTVEAWVLHQVKAAKARMDECDPADFKGCAREFQRVSDAYATLGFFRESPEYKEAMRAAGDEWRAANASDRASYQAWAAANPGADA